MFVWIIWETTMFLGYYLLWPSNFASKTVTCFFTCNTSTPQHFSSAQWSFILSSEIVIFCFNLFSDATEATPFSHYLNIFDYAGQKISEETLPNSDYHPGITSECYKYQDIYMLYIYVPHYNWTVNTWMIWQWKGRWIISNHFCLYNLRNIKKPFIMD